MNIRVEKTGGFDAAYKIAESLPDYFNEQGLRDIAKALQNEILFGAFVEDKLVGFVTYKMLNPEAIELSWIGVLPEYQSKGVGTKLVNDSLDQVNANYKVCKVKTLAETHPDEGFQRTRRFWKKVGFIPIEIIDPYPGWDERNPCQIFVKCLSC